MPAVSGLIWLNRGAGRSWFHVLSAGGEPLQGEWLFQKRFTPTIADSLRRHESKWRRWVRLVGVCSSHPQLFASRAFKQRMREALRVRS
jgi:hypothetical protein